MGTFSERIKKLIEECCDGNQSQFARTIGVKSQRINQIVTGGGELGMEPFYKVITEFKVNPEWLLYEKGEMFSELPAYTHQNAEVAKVVTFMEGMDDVGRGMILGSTHEILKILANTPHAPTYKLPIARSSIQRRECDKARRIGKK